jgi:branched-chain amino acid transport system substrate-binding protein
VDDGLNVRFDTYLAHLIGGPTAIGAAGENRLSTITEFDPNVPVELKKPDAEAFDNGWRAKHDTDFSEIPFLTMFQMLAKAIDKAGSTDALKVALALEDMKTTDLVGFPVQMRKEDHQLLMPYYAATFSKDVKYDAEKTGFGWKTDFIATTEDLTLPTTCKMKRPAS